MIPVDPRLAAAAGDPDTEALAARLGGQEQQTFDRILGKIRAARGHRGLSGIRHS